MSHKTKKSLPGAALNLEEEVGTQSTLFDSIIDMVDDGILLADQNAICIRVNPAFMRISGLTREQLIGVSHHDMAQHGIVSNSCVLKVLQEEQPVTTICEYPITGRKALVTGMPLRNGQGEIFLVVLSVRDVTVLKDMEAQLAEEKSLRLKYERLTQAMQKHLVLTEDIVVTSSVMINIIQMANRLANVDSTILISGETGVGKEVIAKYIHQNGLRKNEPFIAVNCGAIPETLIESELFGYERGSFSGADRNGKIGLIEAASGGTLFLDEVGELPTTVQVKLLRFLQTKEITRVGGVKSLPVDVRIISASHRDLAAMMRAGTFREDLYYRISVVPIHIPPLRERPEEIIPLADHFLESLNRKYGYRKSFTELAYRMLSDYTWPGNIRELKNIIERAAVVSEGDIITATSLTPLEIQAGQSATYCEQFSLKDRVERFEYDHLEEAYQRFHSVRKAADFLKMPVATYVRKRNQYSKKFGGSTPN